jgi:hypothetical protein
MCFCVEDPITWTTRLSAGWPTQRPGSFEPNGGVSAKLGPENSTLRWSSRDPTAKGILQGISVELIQLLWFTFTSYQVTLLNHGGLSPSQTSFASPVAALCSSSAAILFPCSFNSLSSTNTNICYTSRNQRIYRQRCPERSVG